MIAPADSALQTIARVLAITRPLAVVDLETTGTNVERDRIVELALRVVHPDGRLHQFASLVNPLQPIPAEASAVHGITDADVVEAPPFGGLLRELEVLHAADVVAYNGRRFDVKLLAAEFGRVGVRYAPVRIIDPFVIFCRQNPRDLAAAVTCYDQGAHATAHRAAGDVDATILVFAAQLERHSDLPRSVDELHAYCENRDPSWLDQEGKIRWADGAARITFGKHAGVSLKDLTRSADGASFLRWMLAKDFPADTKQIVREALQGRFPSAPMREETLA